MDRIEWLKWAIHRCTEAAVFRLSLSSTPHGVEMTGAMIVCARSEGSRDKLIGVTRFKEGSSVACATLWDYERWADFLKEHAPDESTWRTESDTGCTLYSVNPLRLEYLSMGTLLAMEHLNRFWGMIYQARATAEDERQLLMLQTSERELENLLATKRRQIATLVTGL